MQECGINSTNTNNDVIIEEPYLKEKKEVPNWLKMCSSLDTHVTHYTASFILVPSKELEKKRSLGFAGTWTHCIEVINSLYLGQAPYRSCAVLYL